MEYFNKQRFCKYANWDLTINKGFYRNLALVIFFSVLGVTICSFIIRWGVHKMTYSEELFSALGLTGAVLFSILAFELYVACGCVFHPLRNKQGRITNLTLPATNLEKYLWHVGLCVVGTIVVGVVSVALCDALYALMTVCTVGKEAVSSLFTTVFNPVDWGSGDLVMLVKAANHIRGGDPAGDYLDNLLYSSVVFIYAALILQSGIYTYGNSVKYRYNIPITYVILQLIGFILFIMTIFVLDEFNDKAAKNFVKSLPTIIYTVSAVQALLGVWFFLCAYRRYTRAQLTSRFNK